MAVCYNSPSTRTLGRKRVCSDRITLNSERSPLEALPQDILLKVFCGVEHEDVKQLFHVSKAIREAALIANDLHFGYYTPKNTLAIHSPFHMDGNWYDEIEVPNAPLRKFKSRFDGRNISVPLLASMDEEDNSGEL